MDTLTAWIEVIAICMVIITLVIVAVGFYAVVSLKKSQEVLRQAQQELSFVSSKAVLVLHEAGELMTSLKSQSSSLGEKSLNILHEAHEMIGYVHDETKQLALKASNGIAKATVGSLIIGAVAQFIKKNDKGV